MIRVRTFLALTFAHVQQTGLVDLLLQNDVPFSVQPTPESGGPLAAFGGIGSLLLPLSLLAFFILPRLRNGGKN